LAVFSLIYSQLVLGDRWYGELEEVEEVLQLWRCGCQSIWRFKALRPLLRIAPQRRIAWIEHPGSALLSPTSRRWRGIELGTAHISGFF